MSDVIIVRSTITNPTFEKVETGSFFRPLLHRDFVSPGITEVRFPVNDTRRRFLISKLEREFGQLKVRYGAGGIEE